MSTDRENPLDQSTISLVSGILVDLEHLVEQQLRLTRREIGDELRQRSVDMAFMTVGVGVLFLSAIGLCLSFAHWLHWFMSPAGTDPGWLPLWACHFVVTTALAVAGGILIYAGRARFGSIERYQNAVTEIFKEPL